MPRHGLALVRPVSFRRELPSTDSVHRLTMKTVRVCAVKVVGCYFCPDCGARDFLSHLARAL
jgi:hypothetical protein